MTCVGKQFLDKNQICIERAKRVCVYVKRSELSKVAGSLALAYVVNVAHWATSPRQLTLLGRRMHTNLQLVKKFDGARL